MMLLSPPLFCHWSIPLKVDSDEKLGGSGRRQMSGNGLGPWRSIFMYILNLSFCVEKQFPFPLSTAELLGEYCYNRKQEVNMFMSVITYKLAHRLLFVKRLCEANLLKKSAKSQELGPCCLFKK
jgi:hypothetical protein